MKYIIRIPTSQYAYLETVFEGTAEEAVDEHNRLITLYARSQNNTGLDKKEWSDTLDRYLIENKIDSNVWDRMNQDEKIIINEIRKSLARATNKK